MGFECTDTLPLGVLIPQFIFCVILCIISLVITIKFGIIHKLKPAIKPLLYIFALSFSSISTIYLMTITSLHFLWHIFYCYEVLGKDDDKYPIEIIRPVRHFNWVSYGVHAILLWIVLFLKLFYVFQGTQYQIQKWIIIFFVIIFFIQISFWTVAWSFAVLMDDHGKTELETHENRIQHAIFSINIIASISLTSLFVFKLVRLYQLAQQFDRKQDNDLLSPMVKVTILTIFALPSSFILAIFRFNDNAVFIDKWSFSFWTFVLDAFTNQFVAMLTFTTFHSWYNRLCGIVDIKCKSCCHLMITKQGSKTKHETNLAETIQSQQSKSAIELSTASGTAGGTIV
eukprot:495614_1